ncbi:hypothetical protein Tsubulata_027618 [Turnera subulata]|uniref:Zinc knuckle CX2CX4HX4C domain-containing protein n=1 Tax=Turnera subulata TaxID=218843 RepID=A0A9Q0JN02_9ROSI|nr:hypothetical protein Tsubulata_027618 [Turnera subulata]
MNNIFLIGFELEEDKKKVLKGSPWLVSNMYFCLKGWFPDMILSQVSFQKVLIWVQIHDIPPNLLTHDRVVKIGVVFPVFHFYEPTLEAMLGWQGFIRARVEIETNMPLLPGIACLDQSGKEIWIKFKYERLGELCVRSGRITHPTSRCTKPPRPDEGVEKPAENSFGPWMRAKETLGKYYPAKKQVPLEWAEPNMEEVNPPNAEYNGRAPSTSSSSEKQGEDLVSRKRKLPEEDVLLSPISESARRGHTGLMNTVAELVTDLHDTAPIHASASKPSWKKMARRAKVVYQPTPVELIQAFEATVEGSKDAMGQEAGNGLEVIKQKGYAGHFLGHLQSGDGSIKLVMEQRCFLSWGGSSSACTRVVIYYVEFPPLICNYALWLGYNGDRYSCFATVFGDPETDYGGVRAPGHACGMASVRSCNHNCP